MNRSAMSDQSVSAASPRRSWLTPLLLVAGILSRTWLWFVGGCLLLTLVPLLVGWRPYVIESGSMLPRINVGDVILAAPVDNVNDLLGRVTVFTDPGHPSTTKSHRVVAVDSDGTLRTRGDANPTDDSAPVPYSDVRGLGRLLVAFVGLPLIWAQTGQWLLLGAFALSLLLAAVVVSRDQKPDDERDDERDDDSNMGDLLPMPVRLGGGGSTTIAASRIQGRGLMRGAESVRTASPSTAPRPGRSSMLVRRTAYVALLGSTLAIPGAGAAFAATSSSAGDSWAVANWNYTSTLTALTPWLYWKLDETTGTVAADTSGNARTGTYNPNAAAFTRNIVGALNTDTPNRAATLNGTTACINTTSTTATAAPAQLTEIVWFKTTTTAGGKLIGFESPRTGVAVQGSGGNYDRHLYMDGAGKVWFGVRNGSNIAISSPTALNDGLWHMAASTMGATGMVLYIDGTSVGTNANTVGESTTGWFRAGCGNLAGWGASWTGANTPTTSTATTQNRQFAGSLDEVAVWQTALTAAQIRELFIAH